MVWFSLTFKEIQLIVIKTTDDPCKENRLREGWTSNYSIPLFSCLPEIVFTFHMLYVFVLLSFSLLTKLSVFF